MNYGESDPVLIEFPPRHGEVPEWFNGLAWKACLLQKGNGGSNPPLSASVIRPSKD